ncbi:MAG TPA: hypothetical protein VKS03_06995 [Thermoanaerobaculia bacterium]|nr:hypothetical protein [Thermoanaerobaculia bacterium]
MSVFLGGSAYAMVRDIADGFVIPTELTFKKFGAGDLVVFSQEADKFLREVRGNTPATNDVEETRKRQRRMQRLQQAMALARGVQSRR